jgi:hypothetical protein
MGRKDLMHLVAKITGDDVCGKRHRCLFNKVFWKYGMLSAGDFAKEYFHRLRNL